MLRAAFFALVAAVTLQGCGADTTWAPDDVVARARYVHDGPPEIALVTVISNRSGEGAHSALIINASERVIFDPAGTFRHPWAPIQGDVHFGITPQLEASYIGYHTRVTYRTIVHRVQVSPEVAERALQLVKANGAVPKSFCADSISALLKQVPGFEGVSRSFFPKSLMESFVAVTGAQGRTYQSDDPDNNKAKLRELDMLAGAPKPAG